MLLYYSIAGVSVPVSTGHALLESSLQHPAHTTLVDLSGFGPTIGIIVAAFSGKCF